MCNVFSHLLLCTIIMIILNNDIYFKIDLIKVKTLHLVQRSLKQLVYLSHGMNLVALNFKKVIFPLN